jgi:hypothetical protein
MPRCGSADSRLSLRESSVFFIVRDSVAFGLPLNNRYFRGAKGDYPNISVNAWLTLRDTASARVSGLDCGEPSVLVLVILAGFLTYRGSQSDSWAGVGGGMSLLPNRNQASRANSLWMVAQMRAVNRLDWPSPSRSSSSTMSSSSSSVHVSSISLGGRPEDLAILRTVRQSRSFRIFFDDHRSIRIPSSTPSEHPTPADSCR